MAVGFEFHAGVHYLTKLGTSAIIFLALILAYCLGKQLMHKALCHAKYVCAYSCVL
jgi:hypothetical protein